LSWLEFNQRVLEEAVDLRNPLLERLKFFCIACSNLDEFFEVRVAGLLEQVASLVIERQSDGMTVQEVLSALNRRIRRMVEDQYACWRNQLRPGLARHGIRFLSFKQLGGQDLPWLEQFYRTEIRPVLTPVGMDPAHPFPQILNKSLNMIVRLELKRANRETRHLAVVQVPRVLPQLVRLPRDDGREDYVFLAHIIGHFLGDLFPGAKILGSWQFRVTRNSELYIDEDEAGNMLNAVETELHNRRKGEAVRLEVENRCPLVIRQTLLRTLRLEEQDLFIVNGPLNPTRLMALCEGARAPELRFPPFAGVIAAPLRGRDDLFAAIRAQDILMHHPYESFESVVEFLEKAAADPDTLAIKMTLYRTGGDRRIVEALAAAARAGRQVTVVVELRARFDEAENIQWARHLEGAGVNVVYGLVGYKVHAKLCLVVRREGPEIRRYVHLSTGNYNAVTARFYTDLGLLTCRTDFGEDATNLFNLLTGVCEFQPMRKLLVAPFDLHERLLEMIHAEAANSRRGQPAGIVAKMNSLVDERVIRALYLASQAGVKIDLVVRGICCLRPGVRGLSTHITVHSIVDRFLEHSRAWCFQNGGQPRAFITSADWMPRNFFRRIEVAFPVEDPAITDRLRHEVLALPLADNVKARLLLADGTHRRLRPTRRAPARHSQVEFQRLAQAGHDGGSQAKLRTGKHT
jgi:polyphosphate kinase